MGITKPKNTTSEIEKDYVQALYAVTEEMPASLTFTERRRICLGRFGLSEETPEILDAKVEYFWNNSRAETYWTLVELKSNVASSVRGPEDGSENQSYKVKIENGLKLIDIDNRIEQLRKDLFLGDEKTEDLFKAGKRKTKEAGSFEEVMAEIKRR